MSPEAQIVVYFIALVVAAVGTLWAIHVRDFTDACIAFCLGCIVLVPLVAAIKAT